MIMKQYNLGPNGASIMVTYIMATNICKLQSDVDSINPKFLIIDTPGQIELFVYRNSSPFLIENLQADEKMNIFVYYGSIVDTPNNFVSVSLLVASIRLRLNIPTPNVLTKIDLIQNKLEKILKWSNEPSKLEQQISNELNNEKYTLTTSILRSLNMDGLFNEILPISNIKNFGFSDLEVTINRMMNLES